MENNTTLLSKKESDYNSRLPLFIKTFALASVLSFSSCGDDEQLEPNIEQKNKANLEKAEMTKKIPDRRCYDASEDISIALTTKNTKGFGNVELDIHINGKKKIDNYKTDTDGDNKINFTIDPEDLGKAGEDIKNIEYRITDGKTTKIIKQSAIHNNKEIQKTEEIIL